MAGSIATLTATVLLCTLVCQVKCDAPSNTLIVDTPGKLEDLKAGSFNGQYQHVTITNLASPDVLREPQHFVNAPFELLNFESSDDFGTTNQIKIFPGQAKNVVVIFNDGENPLDGAPRNFLLYELFINSGATITAANMDSILQWENANDIRIYDTYCTAAVLLMDRLEQLNKLKSLQVLTLQVAEDTIKRINVTGLIESLESLTGLTFITTDLSDEQRNAFIARSPAPSDWRVNIIGNHIRYIKK